MVYPLSQIEIEDIRIEFQTKDEPQQFVIVDKNKLKEDE